MKCEYCNTETSGTKGRRFCSKQCQDTSWRERNADSLTIGLRLPVTIPCPACGIVFTREWPNTKQSACSRACSQAIYREKNREKLSAIASEWAKRNRSRRLEIQRKWNNSEKGAASKKKYYDSHLSEIAKKTLSMFHEDEQFRKVMIARVTSSRRLKASSRPYVCEACGSTKKLQCHHVDWNPLNWQDMSNLQWLCVRCHNLVHSEAGLGK